jgi:hypothetical protein
MAWLTVYIIRRKSVTRRSLLYTTLKCCDHDSIDRDIVVHPKVIRGGAKEKMVLISANRERQISVRVKRTDKSMEWSKTIANSSSDRMSG